jgi:hypothetical protein
LNADCAVAADELQRLTAALAAQLGESDAGREAAPLPGVQPGVQRGTQRPPPVGEHSRPLDDSVHAALASPLSAAACTVYAMTAGVVADIHALSQCGALVGTCLSQVSRTAYDIAYARGIAQLPPVGMDTDACAALQLPHPYAILAQWQPPTALPGV